MNSPISNRINTIFVHGSDLKRSVKWYSELIGQEVNLGEVSNPVHNLKIDHHTGLTLDAGPEGETKAIHPSGYPLFNFHTEDIHRAYKYVSGLGYKIESDIVSFDDFSFFTVEDLDGNVVMICTG